MPRKKLFSIGEAAQICGVSIRTLRYYDSIGLLSPAQIETDSGYRYYSQKQIFLLALIQDLKSFDFSLKEIQEALKREDLSRIAALFESRRAEMNKNLAKIQKNITRIDSRLLMIHEMSRAEQALSDPEGPHFQLKDLPERPLVSLKKKMAFENESIVIQITQVQKLLGNEAEGPYVMVFHENYQNPHDTLLEIGTLVSSAPLDLKGKPIVQAGFLKSGLYAVSLHRGDHASSVPVYENLLKWMEENHLKPSGPPLKVYLKSLAFARSKDRLLTEIQIPVFRNP